MKRSVTLSLFLILFFSTFAQDPVDTVEAQRLARMISLSEVVIRTDINVARFIERVKNDSTFYKAFKNLRVLGFTSLNNIWIRDKKGQQLAGLQSKTRQIREGSCRSMELINETVQGDFYDRDRQYNYYTAELYASLFFTEGKICNETNIIGNSQFSTRGKKGVEKHKEQLKFLMFNPGKRVPGIPLMSDRKLDIFDPDQAEYYDFFIDQEVYEGRSCYIFSVTARPDLSSGQRDKIVIDKMITWFDAKTMEVMKRNYSLSYDAGVYDFDVDIEVELTHFGELLVPKTLRYTGNWDVMFKKRERGGFAATLFDFTR